MVGLGRSWRSRLGLGPSRAEREAMQRREERQLLLQVLQDERQNSRQLAQQHHQVMVEVLKGIASNSNSFAEWMKMIGSAGDNRVRIMTDELEAFQEKDRAKNMRDMFTPLRETLPAKPIPMSNVEADHAALLQDLLG